MDGGGGPGVVQLPDAGRPTMLADTRTNSILVRAGNPARVNSVKQLIAKLDTPSAGNSNVHVVYLRNAEATKLAQVLSGVLSGRSGEVSGGGRMPLSAGAAGAGNAPPSVPGAIPNAVQNLAPGGSGGSGSGSASGAGYSIQADASSNSLIISAPEPVYKQIRAVIDQLDTRRAQVSIETMIVEVSSDKVDEIGVQWQNLFGQRGDRTGIAVGTNYGSGGNNILQLSAAGASGNVVTPGQGINLGVVRNIAGTYVLGAFARALESVSGTNVLSRPNLLAIDNEEAKFTVGQNVPFITGQFTNAGGGANVNPFQTIERRDVGLTLKVRPQIGEGGTIRLQIYQEVSSVSDRTRPEGLITNKRAVETTVIAEDGEAILLGGLMQDEGGDSAEKVPYLADAPIVGGLFRNERRNRTKTNLMIFLRPVVLKDALGNASIANERYDYMRRQVQSGVQQTQSWLPASAPMELPALPSKQADPNKPARESAPGDPSRK
jgi:general secretion pathway protein D